MEERRYREVETRSECSRIYYVVGQQAGPWISIFNESATLLPNVGFYSELDQLALALSAHLKATLLNLQVHDSDVVHIQLLASGSPIDTFSNWVNYESWPKRKSGKSEKWQCVLPDRVTPQALEQAWEPDSADYPFEAEGSLERIARLLQLDEELVFMKGGDLAALDTEENPDISSSAGAEDAPAGPLTTVFYFQRA